MEKPPRPTPHFEMVTETPLSRVRDGVRPTPESPDIVSESLIDLSPAKRRDLRHTLRALGFTLAAFMPTQTADEKPFDLTESDRPSIEDIDLSEYAPSLAPKPTPRLHSAEMDKMLLDETVEFMSEPERRLEGYVASWTLPYDQILFVDDTNRPVAKVPLATVYEEKRTKNNGELFLYANTSGYGGGLNLPVNGIPKEWLEATRKKLAEQYPDNSIGKQYNVIKDFTAALRENDEPKLIAKIKSGEIMTLEGIVRYFADKPVVGAEEYSRLEYVYEKIEFPDSIPERVQIELRRLIPGLAAQESKFNNDLKSSKGAEGIFQLMPATSQGLGMKPEEINSLIKQVEAVGRHFGNIYQELHSAIKAETLAVVRSWYESEEAYEKYFLIPMMITAYNVGGTRMAEAVEAFVIGHPSLTDAPDNLATFFALIDYAKESKAGRLAKFDVAGASYYTKVAAAAVVFSPQYK